MLYQRNHRAFIENFIGNGNYYGLRNYLQVQHYDDRVDFEINYANREKLFSMTPMEYNLHVKMLNQNTGTNSAKNHHFAVYFYMKEKGLLPLAKAMLIKQGIPADHRYVRNLV
jgi:hypothetical protein